MLETTYPLIQEIQTFPCWLPQKAIGAILGAVVDGFCVGAGGGVTVVVVVEPSWLFGIVGEGIEF